MPLTLNIFTSFDNTSKLVPNITFILELVLGLLPRRHRGDSISIRPYQFDQVLVHETGLRALQIRVS